MTSSPDETLRATAIQKEALLGSAPAPHPGDDHPDRPATSLHGIGAHVPAANSLSTAIALSLSAGYLDGFTYLGHGHVFASAMTGNMVLLGIRVATLDPEALKYISPILAYVTDVILANIMMRESVRRHLPVRPHVLTLLIEIAVLLAVAYVPLPLGDDLLVSVITISTSMQNTSFRNIGTRTYNSVIMTGNLQAFSNALAAGTYPFTPARLNEARDLGGVLSGFVVGAALGAIATPHLGLHAIVVPAVVLAVGVGLLLLARDEVRVGRPDAAKAKA